MYTVTVMAYAAVLLAVLVVGSDEDGCSRFNVTDCDIEFIENACPIMCDVDTDKEETSFVDEIERAFVIVTVPVAAMMIGSMIAVFAIPGSAVKILFSSVASGILIGAVGLELFPVLHEEGVDWYAGPLGIIFGAGVFIILARVLDAAEDEDEEEVHLQKSTSAAKLKEIDSPSGESRPLLYEEKNSRIETVRTETTVVTICSGESCSKNSEVGISDIEDLLAARELSVTTKSTSCIGSCEHGPHILVNGPNSKASITHSKVTKHMLGDIFSGLEKTFEEKRLKTGLPWTRLAAISLDGFIDGMLIGIAMSIGEKESMIIAAGMSLEMMFVGVALSGTLQQYAVNKCVKIVIVLVIPLFMYLGLVLGAYGLYSVDETSDIFVGVIGFGATALLYLALIELLPEALETAEEANFKRPSEMVSIFLFLGIAIVVLLESLVDEF